jgi:CheY-specific phosphatase CheX
MTGSDPLASKTHITLDAHIAEVLQRSIERTLSDTFNIVTRVEMWSVEMGPVVLDATIACAVQMKDEHADYGNFIIALNRETVEKVLRTYGVGNIKDQAVLNDAAEEITNMIYGMLKTALNKMGYGFTMEIPHVIKEKTQFTNKHRNVEKMILPFLTEGHRSRAVIAPNA